MDARPRSVRACSETRFAAIIALGHLAAATAAQVVHEPWRDEMQAWLIARDATGPISLLHNLRYEGHPALWYALLWPLTRLGGPGLMQALAVGIGAATTYVFARWAPFPRLARALFAFGYLSIWEWSAIARNYGAGALLLFAAAALAARRERFPVLLGAALGLAANTSALAAFSAAGLLALLLVERFSPWRDPARAAPGSRFWAGAGLAGAGILACGLQVMPPPDSAVASMWGARTFADRIGKALASPVHGLACLPWGGALEPLHALGAVQIALAVAIATALTVTATLVLSQHRGAWIAAALPAAVLVAFFFFRYYGGARHAGFLLLSLLVALWVAPTYPLRPAASMRAGRGRELARRALGPVLAATFAFQVLGTAVQGVIDGLGVDSAARDTAALIRAERLDRLPLVADPDFATSNVLAFLGKPAAYYANVDRWGSFTVWDRRHAASNPTAARASDERVFARAAALAGTTDVLVVLNRSAAPDAMAGARARLVGARAADLHPEESYWVYVVPRR
jgi:hypothetical protein